MSRLLPSSAPYKAAVPAQHAAPCANPRPLPRPEHNNNQAVVIHKCAMAAAISAGLVASHGALPPQPATAAPQPAHTSLIKALPSASAAAARNTFPQLLPPPLAFSLPLPSAGGLSLPLPSAPTLTPEEGLQAVEAAGGELVHWLQHGAEAVGQQVHHLQLVHALERLERVPFEQVVDVSLLKAALHPSGPALPPADPTDALAMDPGTLAALAARQQLDAALDAVGLLALGEVISVDRFAAVVQDVPYEGPLSSRSLQAAAPRIRRAAHWEQLAGAVRHPGLRAALGALGGAEGSAFAELDVRSAVSAVRMDTVLRVLQPPRPAAEASRALDSSGLWTWEAM